MALDKKTAFSIFLAIISLGVIFLYLFAMSGNSNIIYNLRLPRLVLTLMTGMVLGGIGSVYQLMLANPLAEPYILGISSGSAFGSILLGVLGFTILMPLGGFAGALLTMILVWSLANKRGSFDKSRLLIAGIVVGMFFSAGISLIMYLFHRDSLIILGTLMGNLGRIFSIVEWRVYLALAALSIVVMIRLYRRSLILDIMSGGDVYAGSVGIDVNCIRREIFVLSSLLIGICVAYAGIIGFVGLIIPHIVRHFIPNGQKRIFLYSLWSGGVFLLCCDFVAKHITTLELPVGVITAAVGCPFFMWLLLRK